MVTCYSRPKTLTHQPPWARQRNHRLSSQTPCSPHSQHVADLPVHLPHRPAASRRSGCSYPAYSQPTAQCCKQKVLKNICGRKGGGEGRRGTQQSSVEGLHTPRRREPRQIQDRREGCQGQEPVRTAKGAAAGRYSHALQNAGLRLGGGRANALCRGQCHRPEPVLSLPSSSEPSLVPSSTPHLLMVCENLRKADTVPALKRETTQQGGLKE